MCFTVIVPLLRGVRGDRFHLWSRMLMIVDARSSLRLSLSLCHRWAGGSRKWVKQAAPEAQTAGMSNRVPVPATRYTHINLHIFGPYPSSRVPRGNPPTSGQPVPRSREESGDVLTVSFVTGPGDPRWSCSCHGSVLGLPTHTLFSSDASLGKYKPRLSQRRTYINDTLSGYPT